MEVTCNIGKAQIVWRWSGKMLQGEGVENRVSAFFYRTVVQAILMFGAESYEMSDEMMMMAESNPVGLLRQITGKQARRQDYGPWETPADKEVQREVGMQSTDTYIGHRQAKVAH